MDITFIWYGLKSGTFQIIGAVFTLLPALIAYSPLAPACCISPSSFLGGRP